MHVCIRFLICIAFLDLVQPVPAQEKDFRIQVSVEEVRLDAVVLDKKGHQITDLSAEDFEIFQNGFRQKIVSCKYINQAQPRPEKPRAPARDSGSAPRITAPILAREDVQRVIVFVVDDISMGFTEFHWARMGLTKFIESQMQPGDLVAIVRTSRGISANQMFSSDKRHLQAVVQTVRYGDSTHWDVAQTVITGEPMPPLGGQDNSGDSGQADPDTRVRNLIEAQLWTIRYCIRALQEMPGRKSLILMTPRPYLPSKLQKDFWKFNLDYDFLYQAAYTRVADEALRAGVVIHTMDIRGLLALMESGAAGARSVEISGLRIPLAQKTGGLFIEDNNFFVTESGIGAVSEELKGYYLLSYIPPESTFQPERRNFYNRVKIKVKRKGSQVHTREGFFGRPQEVKPAAQPPPLLNVVFSPFSHKELEVRLASGFVADAKMGYLLRSWLNLDAKNLKAIETEDGNHQISLAALCVTSDIQDVIQDVSSPRYVFGIRKEDLQWVRDHGIRFSLFLPVKKPGAYYVRAAVEDQASGAVGSAYQFIEIPNLKKRRLSLSNIFVSRPGDDLSWVLSGMEEKPETRFSPILSRDENKSPTLRRYLPGESVEYVAVIYNAKTKEKRPPELESQIVLFRDGMEVYRGEPQSLEMSGLNDFERILFRKKVTFGKGMVPGEYILQLRVRDKLAKKKYSVASQALGFEMVTRTDAEKR